MKTSLNLPTTVILAALAGPSLLPANPPLKEKLEARAQASSTQTPEATRTAYAAGIKAVEDSGIVKAAKQTGETAPDFTLTNATGQPTQLANLLKKGPVILTWYRGGWCPYCNLTLIALQEELPAIHAAGAQLVALTPELPDKTAATAAKNRLNFEVLTDLNHATAKAYGILFKLTPEVRDLYQSKFNLTDFNGATAGNDQLPLAATYIIGQDGVIRYAFLHADYRQRAEPKVLSDFLQANRALLTTKS